MQPVLRLLLRWVRRPLLPALRLWRRNIQVRVVATTLLMSIGVVLLLGIVVIGQVRNGLRDAKLQTAQVQVDGGFQAAERAAERPGRDSGTTGRQGGAAKATTVDWLNSLVEDLQSSGKGVYSVVTMSSDVDNGAGNLPRGTRFIDLDQGKLGLSLPRDLRQEVEEGDVVQRYGRAYYSEGSEDGVASLIVGKLMRDPNGGRYQLYYVFPFTQEEKTLSLVKGTLASAGVFVVVLLGAIAWLVVRQVVTPVRMAAGISERLAAGRLQERMKVTGEDDIARLGESFNKMAQNLQQKIQQLEDLSRMQRRFVSDVSHELRTPLTTVRMAADVIHEGREDFDPVTARSAELLLDQLDRFESLLSDLLEISRFDAGAAALEAEPVDLRDVVRRVVDGALPLAERKGSAVLVRGDAQPVIVEADARRVERVLRNLVVNAVEHGDGRDVVVRLGAAGGAVAVAVRDYGVGLKPGEATRVFNRFWRADPARARTTGGTGLGLSIAVEDARLHGGWLQAWGEPGGGSQFRLTLPRTVGEPLRGSPIPLEPEDSRAHRELREREARALGAQAGPARGAGLLSAVPAQGRGHAAADPTALPGNGTPVRRNGERGFGTDEPGSGADARGSRADERERGAEARAGEGDGGAR
ncbi:MtrAB system histidine kinase MtrB [Streptomyces boninensis]|uniref:MtrAB system histidine kinase MtrB n=1 Tax=Streptomyces boninensis TaxID=2039455 RepID=UPI003B21564C